jgi:hypothetical protein
MGELTNTVIRRRDLLTLGVASAGAALTDAVVAEPAAAKSVDLKDKRKSRYQANSAEVRNFYRVCSYPVR